jgi:hypothetical protein
VNLETTKLRNRPSNTWRDEVREYGRLVGGKRRKERVYYYYLTVIGLTPGSTSIHLHTNSTQNTEDGTHITITWKKTIARKKITITIKKIRK